MTSTRILMLGILLLAGCHSRNAAPPATQRATDLDPQLATPEYWWSQPAAAIAESASFDSLFAAARLVAVDNYFTIDRSDYRDGLMTTFPLVSKQFFEFWRHDVIGAKAVAESSLATIRRTIHFQIIRLPNGRYRLLPKVLIERYCIPERRITTVAQYDSIFSPSGQTRYSDVEPAQRTFPAYWYAVGRDADLEKFLATEIQLKS
jgi:hypothetical protein